MSSEVIAIWSQYGLAGCVIVTLFVQVRYLQSKLVSVIEDNTRALADLRGVIERCQFVHGKGGHSE